jgi:type III secretory pathway component EscS
MQDHSPVPASFSVVGSPSVFQVAQNADLKMGTYKLKLIAVETNTGLVNSASVFNVVVKCLQALTVIQPAANVTYMIDFLHLTNLTLTMPVYGSFPTWCTLSNFTYQLVSLDFYTLPPMIFQSNSTTWHVSTQDSTLVGTYNFQVVATE